VIIAFDGSISRMQGAIKCLMSVHLPCSLRITNTYPLMSKTVAWQSCNDNRQVGPMFPLAGQRPDRHCPAVNVKPQSSPDIYRNKHIPMRQRLDHPWSRCSACPESLSHPESSPTTRSMVTTFRHPRSVIRPDLSFPFTLQE
jgi:hypothetical protein